MVEEYRAGLWPEDEDQTLSFGLGWDNVELFPFEKAGVQVLAKGGDTLQYHATLMVAPEHDLSVAVLSSGGTSSFNQLLASRILIDALAEKGITVDESVPGFPEASPAAMPKEELEKAGLYGTLGQTFEINISESGELTSPALLPNMTLRYHSDGSYRDENGYIFFKLIKESDGNTYLFQKSYMAIEGLPPMVTSLYAAQQLPPRDVDPDLWSSWEAYNNHSFFLVNEPPTSELYLFSAVSPFSVVKNEYGYINGLSIIDKTTLMPVLTIPGVGSRDYQPITLMQENEKTYMRAVDYLLLSQNNISDIYAGYLALCTIQKDGHARWYSVGAAQGKTMTLLPPEDGAFYVYDASGAVVASSVFEDSSVTLPEGGHIVFLGKPSQFFLISIA